VRDARFARRSSIGDLPVLSRERKLRRTRVYSS
jgi:hypothetical protein